MSGPGGVLRIVILGGTGEARSFVETALARHGPAIDPITSLAGRTQAPAALPGRVRIGGFGGPAGLAGYLRAEAVDLLVDATHPFARHMPHHAAEAAAESGIPRLRLERAPWRPGIGDRWHSLKSVEAAAECLPDHGRRALVTVGAQEATRFAAIEGAQIYLRAIDAAGLPPERADLRHILARGPFDLEAERALLAQYRIDLLVTKNSGGAATVAKLEAARAVGIPVLMVDRPTPPVPGPRVETVAAALDWLAKRLEERRRDVMN
ncbi:cobalt-precorrin-6A reductase [Marivibrio halodurans]|uniref:Cobalt-precorrin-6A reductase n=1 Tax=Marivibrio halodurans TaxID=2039722 RepID=A0A8J7S3W1_9PROT|nr:cobalt-precorrin-6A reductase [Marivibrio halodurans]MBP5858088.1 cobalt-precorrin-6A reductase [Marivibrio halodurans]